MKKTFPIRIFVTSNHAQEMTRVLYTMITNFSKWESGELGESKKEDLKFKFGEHISNNVQIIQRDVEICRQCKKQFLVKCDTEPVFNLCRKCSN